MQLPLVNSVHEHLTARRLHLQTSHQTSSKQTPRYNHTTAIVHYDRKTICTCTPNSPLFRMKSSKYRITGHIIKKEINSQLLLGRPTTAHESITATNLALKTSQHETNLKHENFTVSNHINYTYISVAIAQKHFTASTISCLQQLGLVGMVS